MDTTEHDILLKVTAFAEEAHGNQMRKFSKERYITHPVKVMEIVREYTHELPVLAAALLHDVLEDTPIGNRELGAFLHSILSKDEAAKTLRLVEELTDIYIKSDYPNLNRRARRSLEAVRLSQTGADAQTIKYADIIDNTIDITHQDTDFVLVYIRESKQILEKMDKGTPQLRQRAMKTVDQALREFWNKTNVRAL